MIGRLFGKICDIYSDKIIINISGACYIIFCSKKIINKCIIGNIIELIIQAIIKEHYNSIFGFLNKKDKKMFDHLLDVQGISTKLAQTIINQFSVNEVIKLIERKDIEKFKQINGIGLKIAEKIIKKLKMKKNFNELQNIKKTHNIDMFLKQNLQNILNIKSILINLGYKKNLVDLSISNNIIQKKMELHEFIKCCIKTLARN